MESMISKPGQSLLVEACDNMLSTLRHFLYKSVCDWCRGKGKHVEPLASGNTAFDCEKCRGTGYIKGELS